jgi:hypothetical protein
MAAPDPHLLQILHLTEEDYEYLHSKGWSANRLSRTAQLLTEKLLNVRPEVFTTNESPMLGQVLTPGAEADTWVSIILYPHYQAED